MENSQVCEYNALCMARHIAYDVIYFDVVSFDLLFVTSSIDQSDPGEAYADKSRTACTIFFKIESVLHFILVLMFRNFR